MHYNRKYRDLEVWKKAVALAVDIYAVSRSFPKEELYGISQQMRRCAVSIPSNIAEGSRRRGYKEFVQFLHIAIGSAAELATQSIIAHQSGMLQDAEFFRLETELDQMERMLFGLIKSVSPRKPETFPLLPDSQLTTYNSQPQG